MHSHIAVDASVLVALAFITAAPIAAAHIAVLTAATPYVAEWR
jgi:hypothetical protein